MAGGGPIHLVPLAMHSICLIESGETNATEDHVIHLYSFMLYSTVASISNIESMNAFADGSGPKLWEGVTAETQKSGYSFSPMC